MMKPPGSRPGISAFAIRPTIKPIRIAQRMLIVSPASLRDVMPLLWRGWAARSVGGVLIRLWDARRGPFGPCPLEIRCALRIHKERIHTLARRHEQAVALLAAEADVGATLGQVDVADRLAVGREDAHTLERFA